MVAQTLGLISERLVHLMSYIVADEYDWQGPFKNRTEARKACDIWKREGRNAEVLRRVPKALAARPRAIVPKFYERSADQVFNHSQPITAPDWDVPQQDPYWDAPHNEQPQLPEPSGRWAGWIQREPEALALSPTELWREHRGYSA